jgi:hypothetical protein
MDKMDRHISPGCCGVSFHNSDEALHARPANNEDSTYEADEGIPQRRRRLSREVGIILIYVGRLREGMWTLKSFRVLHDLV